MIELAIAALVLAGFVTGANAAVVRSLVRQQARERDLLLNQIMHLSGRTWTPPPAADRPEPVVSSLIRSPEQMPEDEWDSA